MMKELVVRVPRPLEEPDRPGVALLRDEGLIALVLEGFMILS